MKKASLVSTELGRRVVAGFARGACMHTIAKLEQITVLTVERMIRNALISAGEQVKP
jgi:hypothetical protein